jgi:hypothetical protein
MKLPDHGRRDPEDVLAGLAHAIDHPAPLPSARISVYRYIQWYITKQPLTIHQGSFAAQPARIATDRSNVNRRGGFQCPRERNSDT